MKYAIIVLVVLASLTLISFILAYILFRIGIVRGKEPDIRLEDKKGIPQDLAERASAGLKWMEETEHKDIEITSFDGLKLHAIFYRNPQAKGTFVSMHGYKSFPQYDFCSVAREIYSLGYSILFPDQRACRKSEGRYITFGVRESKDCAQWAAVAEKLSPGTPIVLHGVSLGSSTVLMALGEKLPDSVRCVISDCGFVSPYQQLKYVLKEYYHLPAFPLLFIADFYCRSFGGFYMKEKSAAEILGNNHLPVLFIHGGSDHFVPTECSRINFDADSGPKKLIIVEGAGHAMSYGLEPERIINEITVFLNKYAVTEK